MTDVISSSVHHNSQYGSLKRRASSPVDRTRVVSRRRLDPLTPDDFLSNDEQRALDELTVKAIRAYRGTVFDPVHTLKSYIKVCDELEAGKSDRLQMRRLLDERAELELLIDRQGEFTDRDLMIIRTSPPLRRKLLEKLPIKDEKPAAPASTARARSLISPPLTNPSQPSSSSPRPPLATQTSSSAYSTNSYAPQGRIPTPLQISSTQAQQRPPHITAARYPSTRRIPEARGPSPPLPEIALPRSYGPPPPGHGSFKLSPTSPPPMMPSVARPFESGSSIPSVARPAEPEGPGGRYISPHQFSNPYALRPDSAPHSPNTPISSREVMAAAGQPMPQPSVMASPVGPGAGQSPMHRNQSTWFIPYHAPGPSGPDPHTFDFPKGTTNYKCPWCDKSYTGANARSVWRRHAQEKHNLPTLLRKRSRWDTEEPESSKPRTLQEKKERNLASKRQWAKDNRLKKKMLDELGRLPVGDPYRNQLQMQLDMMSKKHKAWEHEWTVDGEEFPDIPATDADDDSEDDSLDMQGTPSVMAPPTEPHPPPPPMSFRIPSGPNSDPVSPVYHRPPSWHAHSGPATVQRAEPYSSSSAGDSSRRPSMASMPEGERKHSLGGMSGYSGGDITSPRGSSEGDMLHSNSAERELQDSPARRKRRKPGEWVIKTDLDRCDVCQQRHVEECVIGPHKKACILCARKKVQCGFTLSDAAHGRLPAGPFSATLAQRARELVLRERAAPWPEPQPHPGPREAGRERGYSYSSEDTDLGENARRTALSPLADRNTSFRLDEALPPMPVSAPPNAPPPNAPTASDTSATSIDQGHQRAASQGSVDYDVGDAPVFYNGAARCKGCVDDNVEECVVEQNVCQSCREKERACEWKIPTRSPTTSTVPPNAASIPAIHHPSNGSASGSSTIGQSATPQDRATSVVLRQVIQLAEELRANQISAEEVLELMTRILRTKKGFKPGLVEWLEEDRALYKERLLMLIEEMQDKYVQREKGTLGDCMEADRRRRGLTSLPVMPLPPAMSTPALTATSSPGRSVNVPATPRDGYPPVVPATASTAPPLDRPTSPVRETAIAQQTAEAE